MKIFFKQRLAALNSGGVMRYLRYALGETLLIVIGILSAFQLNSWSEHRRLRSIEINTLKEIRKTLVSDKRDLEVNAHSYRLIVTSCDTIAGMLKGEVEHTPKMDKYFSGPTIVVLFFSNKGAYETFKLGGLEIISNDTLRKSLISIYDQGYVTLEKFETMVNNYIAEVVRTVNPHYFDQSYPFTTKNFLGLGTMTPFDFQGLKSNKEYIHHVRTIRNYTDLFLQLIYLPLIKNVDVAIRDLDSEIERLEEDN